MDQLILAIYTHELLMNHNYYASLQSNVEGIRVYIIVPKECVEHVFPLHNCASLY